MGMYVQGVCVGLKDEVITYTKDGKDAEFRSIGGSFADTSGKGEPIQVDMTDKQQAQIQPYHHYKFPVEARAVSTKRGTFCRISIPDNSKIEEIPLPALGSGTSASPGGK